MGLVHALGAGDEERPQQVDVALDLGDIEEGLGDEALEVVSRGGRVWVREPLRVEEGRVPERLGDVQQVEPVDLERGCVHRPRQRRGVERPVRQLAPDLGPLAPELGAPVGAVLGQELVVGEGRPPVAVEAGVVHGVVLRGARLGRRFGGGVGGLGDGFPLREEVQAAELGDGAEEAAVAACEVLEGPIFGGGSGREGCAERVVVELTFTVIDGSSHGIEPGKHGAEPCGLL